MTWSMMGTGMKELVETHLVSMRQRQQQEAETERSFDKCRMKQPTLCQELAGFSLSLLMCRVLAVALPLGPTWAHLVSLGPRQTNSCAREGHQQLDQNPTAVIPQSSKTERRQKNIKPSQKRDTKGKPSVLLKSVFNFLNTCCSCSKKLQTPTGNPSSCSKTVQTTSGKPSFVFKLKKPMENQ